MPRKRFTNEQIAFALRQAENGASVDEGCRKMGIRADLLSLEEAVRRPEACIFRRLGDGRRGTHRGPKALDRVGHQRLDGQFELLDPLAELL